jgi:hypothetical protein
VQWEFISWSRNRIRVWNVVLFFFISLSGWLSIAFASENRTDWYFRLPSGHTRPWSLLSL